jgi:hypothetical protein
MIAVKIIVAYYVPEIVCDTGKETARRLLVTTERGCKGRGPGALYSTSVFPSGSVYSIKFISVISSAQKPPTCELESTPHGSTEHHYLQVTVDYAVGTRSITALGSSTRDLRCSSSNHDTDHSLHFFPRNTNRSSYIVSAPVDTHIPKTLDQTTRKQRHDGIPTPAAQATSATSRISTVPASGSHHVAPP